MSEPHFCPNCGINIAPDQVVEVGGWRIDPRTRLATFGGVVVHFTPNEFTMLHSLFAALGATVRRDALYDRMGSDAEIQVVAIYVTRLRRKLAGRGIRIITVYGTGYRLEAEAE